jgi:hypothetical protein
VRKTVLFGLFMCTLCIQGCQTTVLPEQWGARYQYGENEIIRLGIGPYNAPLVPGRINATDIAVFFDTGNFYGFTISPNLIRILDLPLTGNERKSYDSGGNFRYSAKGYHVGRFETLGKTTLDTEAFGSANADFQASIGVGDLLDRRFTLDLKHRLMGISGKPFHPNEPSIQEFPLVWNDGMKGMIVIEGSVNGCGTLIQIDTGKSRTTIDASLVALAGLKKTIPCFRRDTGWTGSCWETSGFQSSARKQPIYPV